MKILRVGGIVLGVLCLLTSRGYLQEDPKKEEIIVPSSITPKTSTATATAVTRILPYSIMARPTLSTSLSELSDYVVSIVGKTGFPDKTILNLSLKRGEPFSLADEDIPDRLKALFAARKEVTYLSVVVSNKSYQKQIKLSRDNFLPGRYVAVVTFDVNNQYPDVKERFLKEYKFEHFELSKYVHVGWIPDVADSVRKDVRKIEPWLEELTALMGKAKEKVEHGVVSGSMSEEIKALLSKKEEFRKEIEEYASKAILEQTVKKLAEFLSVEALMEKKGYSPTPQRYDPKNKDAATKEYSYNLAEAEEKLQAAVLCYNIEPYLLLKGEIISLPSWVKWVYTHLKEKLNLGEWKAWQGRFSEASEAILRAHKTMGGIKQAQDYTSYAEPVEEKGWQGVTKGLESLQELITLCDKDLGGQLREHEKKELEDILKRIQE